jgi:hypothetical protein
MSFIVFRVLGSGWKSGQKDSRRGLHIFTYRTMSEKVSKSTVDLDISNLDDSADMVHRCNFTVRLHFQIAMDRRFWCGTRNVVTVVV